ncbi:hypothetical protein D3C81_1126780 [compost metagenome]
MLAQIGVAAPDNGVTALHYLYLPRAHRQGLIAARLFTVQLGKDPVQGWGLAGFAHPVALLRGAWMQAVVLLTDHCLHLHVLLDGANRRQEALTIESIAVQLAGRLVGGGDNHHSGLEQHLEQAPENDRVADIVDEQLVETQHANLFGQGPGQGLQGVGGAIELEQTLMHPAHEVVEMLTPGRHLQTTVELVHQPGLAAPHRAPEIDALRGFATLQGFETALQSTGRL